MRKNDKLFSCGSTRKVCQKDSLRVVPSGSDGIYDLYQWSFGSGKIHH
jgi:hypothetical protein